MSRPVLVYVDVVEGIYARYEGKICTNRFKAIDAVTQEYVELFRSNPKEFYAVPEQ